jgi:tetratricopeptide (TPR) repeat protein
MANGYISVNGSLVAQGTVDHPVVFTAESTQWSGIAVNTGGALNFDYTEISKADNAILCYGAITLTNSTVHLCENGVTLQSTTSPIIQNNQLFDCNSYGLKMSSVASSFGTPVRDNEIYQNGIGVMLYNSTYSLSYNDIHNNTTHALHASSKSSATISHSYLGLTDGTNPEILLIDAYPVIDNQSNDIIFDFGTQSSYSIYNQSSRLSSYSCRGNYWGTTNPFTITYSFYPTSWPVTYSPISNTANTSYREASVEDLLLLAIGHENQGNYQEAESIYKSIVSTYPDSLESLQSLGHLLNCNTSGGQGYEDLRQYYLSVAQDTLHSDISYYAEDYAILCNRRLQMFDEALRDYENQLINPLNAMDSLFTEIDIVQTIQEANASNVGRYALSRSELQRVQKREQELFGLLTREFKPANGTPNPSVPFKLHSAYPNPFNPTTTISYSIPAAAAVELSIYNVKGQKVVTLVNQHQEAGEYSAQWNGTDEQNNPVASGVYFYKLSDDSGRSSVQKCLLLK